jgi:hypothetical protein
MLVQILEIFGKILKERHLYYDLNWPNDNYVHSLV